MNTKKDYQELIDRLADKTLSFGCRFRYRGETMIFVGRSRHGFVQAIHSDGFLWETATQKDPEDLIKEFEVLGHPIMIGDVLNTLNANVWNELSSSVCVSALWQACGFTKSMQEIYIDIEWADCAFCLEEEGHGHKSKGHKLPTASPQADLFNFLIEIGL